MTVHADGRTCAVPTGTQVRLTPGESIHIRRFLYHGFTAGEGTGPALLVVMILFRSLNGVRHMEEL